MVAVNHAHWTRRIGMTDRLLQAAIVVFGFVLGLNVVLSHYAGYELPGSIAVVVLSLLVACALLLWIRAERREGELAGHLADIRHSLDQANRMAEMGQWEWRPDTSEVYWSRGVYDIFGLPPDSKPLTIEQVLADCDEDDRAAVREHAAASARGESNELRFRYVRPDGSRRTLSTRAESLRDSRDRMVVRGVMIDVTELIESKYIRMRAERQYRFLFDNNPVPMWVFDRETLRFLAVNDAAIDHYGYSRDEFLAATILDLRPPEDHDDASAAGRGSDDMRKPGRVWTHWRKDQSVIRAAVYSHDIDFDGRSARVVAAHDVTERERNEHRFRNVANATNDVIYDWNIETGDLWMSEGFFRTFGYAREGWDERIEAWEALIHPDDIAHVLAHMGAALASGNDDWEYEYRYRRADGEYADVLDRGFISRDPGGRAIRMVGGMLDLTEKRRSASDLRLLRRAVETTDGGILIMDAQRPGRPVVYINPALERLSGYPAAELLGRPWDEWRREGGDEAEQRLLDVAMDAGREVRLSMRGARREGGRVWVDLHITPLRDEEGVLTHFVAVVNDITERRRYEVQLAHRASHDDLTGLPNRQQLLDCLVTAVQEAPSRGHDIAVVFVDLDDFKLVNDSLGHRAGDQVLRTVADRLSALATGTDMVGRFGGDEFVMVLVQPQGQDRLQEVLDQIAQVTAAPIEVDGFSHTITPSIGFCRYPEAGTTAESLLKHADMAMYHAKRQGRNRSVAYQPVFDAQVSQRLQLVARLREALERKEFVLAFQPLFNGRGQPMALEALVRWNHPERGQLPPSEFITTCEESGLIVELGRRVLMEAARHYPMLDAAGFGHLRLAVNISAAQFGDDLFSAVLNALDAYAVPPGVLELELTESVIMDNPQRAIDTMHRISALGVSLSVDDFGTGYSSLAYLKQLPIDRLKIDRSFVRDLDTDASDRSICEAIVAMARSLGLETVAEGVETPDQMQWLQDHGVDELQGYLLGRPEPFEQVIDRLRYVNLR